MSLTTSERQELDYLRGQLRQLTREQSPTERDQIAATMARADGVSQMFGERASPPVPGESSADYRRRMLEKLKVHSPRFAGTTMRTMPEAALSAVEDAVFNDATAAANNPESHAPGTLIPVTTLENGRNVTRFVGDPHAWMRDFMLEGVSCSTPQRQFS